MNATDFVKRLLVGRKLASTQLGETLLPKRIALPVFASDALSSVAYAPDEILLTLSLAGMAGFAFSWEIALAVAVVMLLVVMSYRQTVHAYPSGGGDYEVATVNLGPNAGVVVASALLVDYVLTVAVSVSSGVQNAKAMMPFLAGNEGLWAAVVILALMAMNLRGVRESGSFFAVPTYGFLIGVLGMTAWGLFRILGLGENLQAPTAGYEVVGSPAYEPFVGLVMVVLLARAFSSGCAALTGVEAISNGVPAFREPKSHNAATTLAMLGGIAITMFGGIILLANLTGLKLIDPDGHSHFLDSGVPVDVAHETVMGQLARTIFDTFPVGFFFVITATMIILFLAANTAFNGFPVLGSILARDGFLPRMLHTRGDRLAYSNGIFVLAMAAVGLVLAFNANVTALIQLYVVGVFVSFTISQFGMTRHWTRHLKTETDPRNRARMLRARVINTVGLAGTGIVLIIVLASKFVYGAYQAVLAMAVLFVVMRSIKAHYQKVARETAVGAMDARLLPSRVRAVILVQEVNKPTMRAVNFARATRTSSIEAVTVAVDEAETKEIVAKWDEQGLDLPLKVISSPYREVTGPFVNYVRGIRSDNPRDVVCVYIPEYIVGHWWEQLLHNQTALIVRTRLNFMQGVMVTSVPYQLASSKYAFDRAERNSAAAWRRPGTGQVRVGDFNEPGRRE
ncbi:APC family permease [Propionicimonas sp.]|uniref:APC family permease n=1 Tax=Propionicimonas sp. TaxID=1955623 RepID=UPI0018365C21|nr:APC family permease [Propionicimonas sp.]MBU3977277.1 APC family permease [Actinomycetota bacterium]MBA3021202.1 APC family permease [Propionicimonas sp.]MBU3985787.1 APC family permease [Actinomycetota bacterium]MBU4008572.1 APC family permease [Actinomycetota bacterium]MBU4066278.1 APC family permease [Actinomycetota bacterium]